MTRYAHHLDAPESDVERFYRERIDTVDGSSLTATTLYEDYVMWCEEYDKKPFGLPQFGREFGKLGVQRAKIAGRVRYVGVGFKVFGVPEPFVRPPPVQIETESQTYDAECAPELETFRQALRERQAYLANRLPRAMAKPPAWSLSKSFPARWTLRHRRHARDLRYAGHTVRDGLGYNLYGGPTELEAWRKRRRKRRLAIGLGRFA